MRDPYDPRRNANYDFLSQKQPMKRMGEGEHANLPQQPISRPYGPPKYLDGIINSFTCSIDEISGIKENQK